MDAEQIVRALAAGDPTVDPGTAWMDGGLECAFCGRVRWTEFPGGTGEGVIRERPHEPDCPWRLAREWVAAHP